LIVQRETTGGLRLFDALSGRVLMTVPQTNELAMPCSGRVVLSRSVRAGYELDLFTRSRYSGGAGGS
jgi:hypothetical protein